MSGTGYCTGHDPLIIAGYLSCAQCGKVAYPTDAAWLDGTLVVASYPAACVHTRPRAWLVDPSALTRSPQWCHAPTRTTGEPCRNHARDGGPCHVHGGR